MSNTTDSYLNKQDRERHTRFERFLEEKCFKENPQVLDDDMSDFYDSWLASLDMDKLIDYGNEAMSKE